MGDFDLEVETKINKPQPSKKLAKMIKLDEDIIVKHEPKQKEEKEEPTKGIDPKTIEDIEIKEENNKFSITL